MLSRLFRTEWLLGYVSNICSKEMRGVPRHLFERLDVGGITCPCRPSIFVWFVQIVFIGFGGCVSILGVTTRSVHPANCFPTLNHYYHRRDGSLLLMWRISHRCPWFRFGEVWVLLVALAIIYTCTYLVNSGYCFATRVQTYLMKCEGGISTFRGQRGRLETGFPCCLSCRISCSHIHMYMYIYVQIWSCEHDGYHDLLVAM